MDLNLKDKVIIVTGAVDGLGKAICCSLADEGAKIVINYRSKPEKGAELAEEIKDKYGVETLAVYADVSKEQDIKAMFEKTIAEFSRVDVLVNNAAYCPTAWVKDMDISEWTKTIDVNLTGTFLASRQFVRHNIDAGIKGRIVNITSQAAFRGSTSGHAPYDASKGGIVSFTVSLAREVATDGICVNAVAPGMIKTEMVAKVLSEKLDKYLARIPLQWIAEPAEIADVVTFLASDRASYMTGATVDVSGGMLMR